MIAFAWSANGNKLNRYPTSSMNLLQMNTIKIEMVDLARILRLSDTDVGKFFRTTYLYITSEHRARTYTLSVRAHTKLSTMSMPNPHMSIIFSRRMHTRS